MTQITVDRRFAAAWQAIRNEVRHFAEQHGISIEQAHQLIAQHGNSREALEDAARQMRG